jgi:tRNA(Ile)-lysidine synthase
MIERLEAKAGAGRVIVALSGGGDSVALMHLLAEHLGAAGLHAVVIDHALRTGSADDARRAFGFARALGLTAEIVTLAWLEGGARGQGAARAKRYAALCGAARRLGAHVIATGHTRDDQAETVLLRAARGSGWRGLAGMRALTPLPVWPEGRGLWLARPLLQTPRTALREMLAARGAAWIEDPANANGSFARVRARRTLASLASAGLEPMRFAALAERLTNPAAELDRAALALVHGAAEFHGDAVLLSRALWRGDDAVRQRALSALVTAAGGGASEPPAGQAAALEAQLSAPDFKAATLAGAWLKGGAGLKWGAGMIAIRRDMGALRGRADGATPLPPLAVEEQVESVWDGRLALRPVEAGWSVVVENGKPVLTKGGEARPFSSLPAVWLIEERVEHLLGLD